MKTFVFTCGDINGIGPEIAVKTIKEIYNPTRRKIILIIPQSVLGKLKLPASKYRYEIVKKFSETALKNKNLTIVDIGKVNVSPGKPTEAGGKVAYRSFIEGVKLVKEIKDAALITAPISKEAFNKAGINFPGHTEILAKETNSKNYLMMFLSSKMMCSLATIHISIKEISGNLTKAKLLNTINSTILSLKEDFNINKPKVAVLGLNPHAGENGILGKEEKNKIIPVIDKFKGGQVEGPFVPDAFFANHLYKNYDCVIGMYHDQVLIPFKMMNFFLGVNYTAGLPIVRTSPDHGTAFDIAWKNKADHRSMLQAFKYADKILNTRKNK